MAIYFLFFGQKPTHGNFFGLETLRKRVSDDSRRFIFRRQIFFEIFSVSKFRFSAFLLCFGGAGRKWTSLADSLQFFALDRLIMSCVRPKIAMNMSIFGSEKVSVGGLDLNFLGGYKN